MGKASAIVGFLLCFLGGMAAGHALYLRLGPSTSGAPQDEAALGAAGVWPEQRAAVPVGPRDPAWGSRTALVTLVWLSDFDCAYCRSAESVLEQIRARYGPDKLRIVWKDFPLPTHSRAKPAHLGARAVFEVAGNDAFWAFHDKCFAHLGEQTPASLERWAGEVGVASAAYRAALADRKTEAKVDADIALGRRLGVTGAPALFVNGVFMSGAPPAPKLAAEIDRQIEAARHELEAGTPIAELYTKLCDANRALAADATGRARMTAGPDAPGQSRPADQTAWQVPVLDDDPRRGPDTAPVTIVEFADFECPFSAEVQPTLRQVLERYAGKVRLVFKDTPGPSHRRAEAAAELAHEALRQKGLDGFWQAQDLLFAHQKQLTDQDLRAYGAELGLEAGPLARALRGRQHQAKIESGEELAVDLSALGTPHFFVNGRRLAGKQPFERFAALVDQELEHAAELERSGVAPEELYATIMRSAEPPPAPERREIAAPPADAPWQGGARAKVVIQEFSDFQCAFCARADGSVTRALEAFGPEVKVVWRHAPVRFNRTALLAAEAAQEAYAQQGNEGFWRYHRRLFEAEGRLERPDLVRYAAEQGLDLRKFNKALDDHAHKAYVEAELVAAGNSGIATTPVLVVNGTFMSGAQPYSKLKRLIQLALDRANHPSTP
jgi:protein-disulfide isomerase